MIKIQKNYIASKGKFKKFFIYLFLIFSAMIALFPFYILIITSFKTLMELTSAKYSFFPKDFTLQNYKEIFSTSVAKYVGSIFTGFKNTILIVLPTTFIGVIVSGMSAYSFAKVQFNAKEILFSFLMFMMLVPTTITISTQFLVYDSIGWTGTVLPLVLPPLFGAASTVFFLRQFMRGIPSELCEAAEADGLGKFMTYCKIILPLSMPALSAQFILLFILGYNDYLAPLLYLTEPKFYTLQVVLQSFNSPDITYWPRMTAGAVIGILPLIVVFLVAQKFIINGITVGSVKG